MPGSAAQQGLAGCPAACQWPRRNPLDTASARDGGPVGALAHEPQPPPQHHSHSPPHAPGCPLAPRRPRCPVPAAGRLPRILNFAMSAEMRGRWITPFPCGARPKSRSVSERTSRNAHDWAEAADPRASPMARATSTRHHRLSGVERHDVRMRKSITVASLPQ